MADEKRNRRISEYELDAILTEFRGSSRSDAAPKEPLAERSKRLVMKSMDDAFNAEAIELLDNLMDQEAEASSDASQIPKASSEATNVSPARVPEKNSFEPEPGVKIWNGLPGGSRRRKPESGPQTRQARNSAVSAGDQQKKTVSSDETGEDSAGGKLPAPKRSVFRSASPRRQDRSRAAPSLRIDRDNVDIIEAELEKELRNPPTPRVKAKAGPLDKLEGGLRQLRRAVEVRFGREKSAEEEQKEAGTVYASPEAGSEEAASQQEAERPSWNQKLPSPFLAFMALIALYREQLARGDTHPPTRERDDTLPEMDPKDAAAFYGELMVSLKPRGLAASLLALLAVYISFAYDSALPLAGALGGSLRAAALVLLILELSVVLCGLDIFTSGILAIHRKRMGAETLVSVSCIFSMLDALILASQNRGEFGLPFCAVSAASMAFAIWGSYYTCKSNRSGFRVLYSARDLRSVTGETAAVDGKVILNKVERKPDGFITGCEEENPCEYLFSVLTPFLLLASLVLGLLSSFARGQPAAVIHCISVIMAGAAVFSCTVSYSVPFGVTARKLFRSGSAIAGWTGLRDIGRCGTLVLSDEDVFPKGTVEVGVVRVFHEVSAEKVVSYTGSVVAASGGALASAFTDLMRNNAYSIRKVSAFKPHDGGGVTAVVAGETVAVGSGRFMRLLGIRMQDKSFSQNTLYTAISGTLVGIFELRYSAAGAVRDSLGQLLRSGPAPVFSLRDFNATPTMLQETFGLSTNALRFPAYTERYVSPAPDSEVYRRVDAVVAKNNLETLTGVVVRGRKTYYSILICVGVSALSSIVGMLTMFFRCWAHNFTGPADMLTFMLVWLIPAILAAFWLEQ